MECTIRQERKDWRIKNLKKILNREFAINSFRYVYITAFFFLLSGVFTPIIKSKNHELPFVGVIILYIGLLGGIFLYESSQQPDKRKKYLIVGFGLMGLSTCGIYMMIG